MDIGLLLRLRNTAQEVLSANPSDNSSNWRALAETYTNLRSAAEVAVDNTRAAELEDLMPEVDTKRASQGGPRSIRGQQEVASDALTCIAALAGWLNGLIEEAQWKERLAAESEAYAKERVKAEQGIGFRPPA